MTETERDWTVPALGFESLREAAPHMRRPFSPNSVKWRVVQANQVVPYLDARAVEERLNRLVPDLWEDDYAAYGGRVESKLVICKLTIGDRSRKDVGAYSSQDPEKGGYSDSFKRAALKFGIGQPIYAMKRVYHPKGPRGSDDKPLWDSPGENSEGVPLLRFGGKTQKGKDRWVATDEVEAYLAYLYERWTETDRVKAQFGPVLDHGDEPGAIGDEPPVESDGPTEATPEASARAEAIDALYRDLPAASRKKLPAGQFKALLSGATSAAEYDALEEKVRGLADAS